MFGPSFDKMSDGMKWFIVFPSSILLLAVAWFVFSFTAVTWNLRKIAVEGGTVKVSLSMLDDSIAKTQKFSNFLDQQQSDINNQLNGINTKLTLAKNNPKKFLETNINAAIAGLNSATIAIRKQSAQISDQQKNVKTLQDELIQLKQALKQSSTK